MKAIVFTEYGSPNVLRCVEVEKPAPKADEVLIKIRAASVNALDWRMMRGKPFLVRIMTGGLRKPKAARPGVDVAGEVEAVGGKVTEFKPGDEVFGFCQGSLAEFACTVEEKLALKPAKVSFEQLAAGTIVPVIARRYPLSEGAEAVGYVDAGHAQGKAVVTVDHPSDS